MATVSPTPQTTPPTTGPTLWYKDAVIYELHVRSFYDSNGDGMGDFKGLLQKLDYLQDLGVSAIWLLPFYPSPWRDDGYDISDYTGVHPAYGTLRDFRRFLKAAHDRDLKVITELIINHTSNEHPWFQKSRQAKPGSTWRNYYVWSDTPDAYQEARIIFQDFETSNWTWDPAAQAYYWHRFYSHQPDLNFESPNVQRAVFDTLDFWLEIGVDGLRLDAIPYLFEAENTNCENLPQTHEFLKRLRAHVDAKHHDKMLLAEANQWPEDAVKYFGNGDECHMCFHFPLMPRLFMGAKMEDTFPILDILDQTPEITDSCQWGIFLRNHDELTLEMVTDEERDYMYRVYGRDPRHRINLGIRRRLAPLLDNDRRKIELMNSLLFSLPGTPVIYYGDEIGMGDNVYLGDRDGVRTPMQWSSDKNAGFSAANPQSLYLPVIIDPEYHYESKNIETQQYNPSSLLWWMKRLIAVRRRYRAFQRGELRIVPTNNSHVLAYLRVHEDETVLVIANFSRYPQLARLELEEWAGTTPCEVFSRNPFGRIVPDQPYELSIGSYDYYWFELIAAEESEAATEAGGKTGITLTVRDWESFAKPLSSFLTGRVLRGYLSRARWYREKSQSIRRLRIIDRLAVGPREHRTWILFVAVDLSEDRTETYVLPLALAIGEEARTLTDEQPQAVIASATVRDEYAVIYDGVWSGQLRQYLLTLLRSRKSVKTHAGSITVTRGRALKRMASELGDDDSSRVLKVEQSNTSILYRDVFFLKLYRRAEEGINPDIEMVRYLSDRQRFPHVPTFAGSLEYHGPKHTTAALALLVTYVPSQGDAWSYALTSVGRYFDNILTMRPAEGRIARPKSLLSVTVENVPEEFTSLADGLFLSMIELLGRRTGELHLSLAAETDEKEFKSEPFSRLYQRALYQSLRSLLKRVMSAVNREKRKSSGPEHTAMLQRALDLEPRLLEQFSMITKERIDARKIRIHGDYHLGQVLFTGKDFVIIDLEGEPARPLGERRLKFSAFRDIGGMIRSFHYAVSQQFLSHIATRPEDEEALREWVPVWYDYVAGLFLSAYLETVDAADFVPSDEDSLKRILTVFLLEKAVYEVSYELDNRPDWLRIPISGLEFTLEQAESG
jgi:maltose alpha-D-glucosyltransferase / alpha-amylase